MLLTDEKILEVTKDFTKEDLQSVLLGLNMTFCARKMDSKEVSKMLAETFNPKVQMLVISFMMTFMISRGIERSLEDKGGED